MIDIQRLAREAGIVVHHYMEKPLADFASLYRESVLQELVAGSGEPIGHIDSATDYLADFMSIQLRKQHESRGSYTPRDFAVAVYTADQLAGAVLRERERCAKVCYEVGESTDDDGNTLMSMMAISCAAAIRSGYDNVCNRV